MYGEAGTAATDATPSKTVQNEDWATHFVIETVADTLQEQ